jgi:hypothetical protein
MTGSEVALDFKLQFYETEKKPTVEDTPATSTALPLSLALLETAWRRIS